MYRIMEIDNLGKMEIDNFMKNYGNHQLQGEIGEIANNKEENVDFEYAPFLALGQKPQLVIGCQILVLYVPYWYVAVHQTSSTYLVYYTRNLHTVLEYCTRSSNLQDHFIPTTVFASTGTSTYVHTVHAMVYMSYSQGVFYGKSAEVRALCSTPNQTTTV